MTQHVEREPTKQVTELTADEMERVSGGVQFTLEEVAVKSFSWAHGDGVPQNQ